MVKYEELLFHFPCLIYNDKIFIEYYDCNNDLIYLLYSHDMICQFLVEKLHIDMHHKMHNISHINIIRKVIKYIFDNPNNIDYNKIKNMLVPVDINIDFLKKYIK